MTIHSTKLRCETWYEREYSPSVLKALLDHAAEEERRRERRRSMFERLRTFFMWTERSAP
mgnify:CR=1 FL=1